MHVEANVFLTAHHFGFLKIFFICMNVLHTYIYKTCMPDAQGDQKKASDPGTVDTDGCELNVSAGNQTQGLCKSSEYS